jgi:hypothetical protein
MAVPMTKDYDVFLDRCLAALEGDDCPDCEATGCQPDSEAEFVECVTCAGVGTVPSARENLFTVRSRRLYATWHLRRSFDG